MNSQTYGKCIEKKENIDQCTVEGCYLCAPNKPTECIICEKGFELNSNNQCIKQIDVIDRNETLVFDSIDCESENNGECILNLQKEMKIILTKN